MMLAWWWRYSIPCLLVSSLLLGIGSLLYLARDIGRPFPGLLSVRGGIDPSTPVWWPGMVDGSQMYMYRIKVLDTEKFNWNRFPQILQEAYDEGRSEIPVIFTYQDRLIHHILPVLPFGIAYYIDYKAADIIIGLSLWFLSLIVYRANPMILANRLLAISFCLFALNRWLEHPTLYWDDDAGRDFFHFFAWQWINPFLGVVLVHFVLTFPIRASKRWRLSILIPWYGWAMFIGLAKSSRKLAGIDLPDWVDTMSSRFYSGMLPTILAIAFMGGYYLYLRFGTTITPRVRSQLNIILVGWLCTIPPFASAFINMLDQSRSVEMFLLGIDLRYFGAATPLAFAYTLLRYQSLQGANQAVIVVLVMSSSALVASLGAFIQRWLEPSLNMALTMSPFAFLFTIGLTFGLFWSRQSSPTGLLNKLFHRQALNYGATHRFGNRLIGQTDLDRLPTLITEGLIEELELERSILYQWQSTHQHFIRAGQSGLWTEPPSPQLKPPADWLETPTFISFNTSNPIPTWVSDLDQLERLLPLTTPMGMLGLLGVGKRWDEEIFAPQDMEIVGLIAQQTALFLLTAQQINELRQVPQLLASIQDTTHQRWNQELHDSTQQFLTRLPFFLETACLILTSDSAKSTAILQRCIQDVTVEADNLRQIRSNMDPRQLQQGVAEPLANLCQRMTARFDLPIRYQISPTIDQHTTVENRHALYRVIQQALDNVISHAQATEVVIEIGYRAGQIHFKVQDNGQGFSQADQTSAQEQGRLGLQSMESRITTQGGELTVHGMPSEGTMVQGWLPAMLPNG